MAGNNGGCSVLDCVHFISVIGAFHVEIEVKMRLQKISTFLANRYRSLDKGLLYSSYVLIFFGILLTFAASPGVAARNGLETFYFVKKQLLFLLPMVGALFMMSFLVPKCSPNCGVGISDFHFVDGLCFYRRRGNKRGAPVDFIVRIRVATL